MLQTLKSCSVCRALKSVASPSDMVQDLQIESPAEPCDRTSPCTPQCCAQRRQDVRGPTDETRCVLTHSQLCGATQPATNTAHTSPSCAGHSFLPSSTTTHVHYGQLEGDLGHVLDFWTVVKGEVSLKFRYGESSPPSPPPPPPSPFRCLQSWDERKSDVN